MVLLISLGKILLIRRASSIVRSVSNRRIPVLASHVAIEYLKKSPRELRGVGPKYVKLLESLGIHSIASLLLHLPRDVLVRRMTTVSNAQPGIVQTFVLYVDKMNTFKSSRGLTHLTVCHDAEGSTIKILHFYATHQLLLLKRHLVTKAPILVSGRVDPDTRSSEGLALPHPDIVEEVNELNEKSVLTAEPIYSLTESLTSARLNAFINSALDGLTEIFEDWIPESVLSERSWPSLLSALHAIHNPKGPECIRPNSAAVQRLAHDELVSLFIDVLTCTQDKDFSVVWNDSLTTKFIENLPFKLTASQLTAIQEIKSDLRATARMERLLQGDVGSGKTVVAFISLLAAIEGGKKGGKM